MSTTQKKSFWSASTIALLVTNMVIMAMAILFQWDLFTIVFFFWVENIIIGLFNILRLGKAENIFPKTGRFAKNIENKKLNKLSENKVFGFVKAFFVSFFPIHYFAFCAGHGVFLVVFLGGMATDKAITFQSIINNTNWFEIGSGIVGMIISHGISYRLNYIGKREFENASLLRLMFQPYLRIVWVQVFIIVASVAILALKTDALYLIVLFFVGKTILDLISHQREHKKLSSSNL